MLRMSLDIHGMKLIKQGVISKDSKGGEGSERKAYEVPRLVKLSTVVG